MAQSADASVYVDAETTRIDSFLPNDLGAATRMGEAKMLIGIFFVEGRGAAGDNVPRESNPYPYEQERQAWLDGWDEAAAERATSDSYDS